MSPPATEPTDPTTTAVGTWSGGRYMRFGEPVEEERLCTLLRPGGGIDTVITADAYGAGEADRLLGRALASAADEGVAREDYCLVGAIGHDIYAGERDGARGYPRFTNPELRGESEYADYVRMATERSLQRCGVERFDVLLLHNPDRIGYTSEAVWAGMAKVREEGLTRMLGVAPGPANGFTLDVIGCMEEYGELIDWAMIILGPLEPWPGELVLRAARANDVSLIARVVDYGGLFHDDVLPGHEFAEHDHRGFRPDGWIEAGREKLERMRPIAERHDMSMLQLACAWTLAQTPVRCVAPTLIQEGAGELAHEAPASSPMPASTTPAPTAPTPTTPTPTTPTLTHTHNTHNTHTPTTPTSTTPTSTTPRPTTPGPKPIEDKRAELAAVASLPGIADGTLLSREEVQRIREVGDNTGCMALKGANPAYEGPARPDGWELDSELAQLAERWAIDPARDLALSHAR